MTGQDVGDACRTPGESSKHRKENSAGRMRIQGLHLSVYHLAIIESW